MIFEWDDFGANHIISDMCQTHDCRDRLYELKAINPAFKATLFAVPGEMTPELLIWCDQNSNWIELAVHGLYHTSNYECERMSYREFDEMMMHSTLTRTLGFYQMGFRAPGWQISDEIFKWLQDHGYWVADQGYNDGRRPAYMDSYVNYDGKFQATPKVGNPKEVEVYHGHTWDVGEKGNTPNGIYEDARLVNGLVASTESFQFISELF